ncbi:MFS transporter [Elsinoe ampelina]|uniref:MFS transporter n=1 Tax=Elsinoe ampelina TaxID=302913 RepID=A0A6A6GNW8_9PEZI|nr:MFS transporter [Elsinoe ampelina]
MATTTKPPSPPSSTVSHLEHQPPEHSSVPTAHLSESHKQYLLARHGTLTLHPLPTAHDSDPYNFPHWQKTTNLLLVAFHAMTATFTASAIQSAYPAIAADLAISLQKTTYLTSLQIAILGGAPLFWRPLSQRYGRRPVFLLSLICSLVGNVGCAVSRTFATQALCRAIVAWFISPAAGIGSAVVQETFFERERARYMGWWTLMVTLGVPIAPFLFGFVAQRVEYRWIYWILAIMNGVQFVLYFFLGPETRYVRTGVEHSTSDLKAKYWEFKRLDPTPMRLKDFYSPLVLAARPVVLIPAAAYSMVFLLAGVLPTVEVAQLFAEKFEFDAQQLGLQYLGFIIGGVIGEQLAGPLSDWWMRRGVKDGKVRPGNEHRLWLAYPGFALAVVGITVFLVQTDRLPPLHYNVTPIVGAAIAAAGNQIVTTILVTYAVDCYPQEAGSVGVFVTFVRQIWGFLGPFYFPQMFANVGLRGSAGICATLIIGAAILPTAVLQLSGRKWRRTRDARGLDEKD